MCLSLFPLSKFLGMEDFAALDAPVPITFHWDLTVLLYMSSFAAFLQQHHCCNYLRQGDYVFLSLFVCLLTTLCKNLWNGFAWNFQVTLAMGHWTNCYILVWNLLHAACWKHRTRKSRQKSASGHHRTTLSGYIFATKARIDNWKKTC